MVNIDWQPDKNCSTPLYRQIIDYIKMKIKKGEWIVGDKLPSQRKLSEIFKVNRSTVVEALDELKADGLINGKNKGGTSITNNTWSLMTETSTPNWKNYIESGVYKPNFHTIQVINRLEWDDNIIRLSTGELSKELFPTEAMKKVFMSLARETKSLGYEMTKGSLELREEISKYVKKFGIEASPESILIVSGSLQGLQLISMGLLDYGSTVIVEKPSYIKSLHVFEANGMNLKGIPIDRNGIMVNQIEKNIGKETAILYTIPTFHNPTGTVMSYDRRKELLRLCSNNRLPIIEDNAYGELWLEKSPPKTLKSMDKNGVVLYSGTASKSLAAGMRIGWLIGPEAVIDRLGDVKMQTDYGASSLSQKAFHIWLKSGLYEEYVKSLRRKLKIRCNITLEFMEKYFHGLGTFDVPKGGFYIWLTLFKKIDMKKLFYLSCKNGVLINPGYIYDFNKNYSIRISYAYASMEEIENGLKKLSEIIRTL
ncbi:MULTISPECIES: PLP-dependent aminotransferase family protein [Clostridium]|uniref:MocR-like pyridoxine biosynthesis transcription factor PdxR n=1 Tax=Clostridium TaxID=1485 RepID=UPI000826CCDC|nr:MULTISPECIES: PLP-dependent aminotransferase family protein [Clostridium]PJI09343.1 PLP-dependent aminotransferase family protein [Clostridium sp. CT7]